MRRGQLCDYFVGVGVKRLSAVDAEPTQSNQHEIGTTKQMRDGFLGINHKERFEANYIWLGEEQDGFTCQGIATHYDARIGQSDRSPEWRLYYPSNPVTQAMSEHDALFLAMTKERLLYFIVASKGSTSERQLSWLFDVYPQGTSFLSRALEDDDHELDFGARFILDEIGIEFEQPNADKLDAIIEQFEDSFPSTLEFSDLARLTMPLVDARDDPDLAVVMWLDHEEAMFRRLERRIVGKRIERGFVDSDGIADVDDFISYSLSVQNRRKSRMGRSLEHHLAAVFRAFDIPHVQHPVTEDNHRPDFVFPSIEAYRAAPAKGCSCLTMLGVKSTCKDRWRQVLGEAKKIPRKHLFTLEPGISDAQTTQMDHADLQLVVPRLIQNSYTGQQRSWLWSLAEFIRYVDKLGRKSGT